MTITLNRRNALAGTAAMLAVPVVDASAAADVSPRLLELIEAHTAADQAHEAALDKQEDMETFYPKHAKTRMLLVSEGSWREIEPHYSSPWWRIRDDMRDEIAKTYDRFRSSVPKALSDTVRAEAITDLNRQQRAAYRRLVKVLDEIVEEQERLGFLAVEQEVRDTMDAEIEAMRVVLSYPCRNMAECRAKAEYITSRTSYLENVEMSEGMVECLILSFLPQEA